MAWMIARDDEYGLSHYGVPGMRKGVRRSRAGMPSYVQSKLNARFTNQPRNAVRTGTVRSLPSNKPILTNTGYVAKQKRVGDLSENIRKKLRSNSRYKASRVGMPSYIRR